jgi:transcriptional regulator with XRE-family HTH domain
VADATTELGARLRAIRSARGHSLSTVAEATGISTSFLSLVETGKNDITFGRLRRLIDFYDVTLEALLPPADDPVVVRAGEHRHLHFSSEGIDLFVLVPGVESEPLYSVLAIYEPDAQLAESAPEIEGMILIFVLDGTILLELAGSPPVALGEGDSAHFSGMRERRVRTGPDSGARFIFVATPSPFGANHRELGGAIPATPS